MTPDDAVDPHGGEGGVKGGHQVSLSHTATQVEMSNQRFLKIVCFRFPTNVPKKIEYIRI